MDGSYQQRGTSFSTASADRAQKALNFLKNELPHWEDMLKYLDYDDSNGAGNAFVSDEIDINVVNYKIKLSRYLDKNQSTGKSQLWVYNSFEWDANHSQTDQLINESNSREEMNSYSSKPDFK